MSQRAWTRRDFLSGATKAIGLTSLGIIGSDVIAACTTGTSGTSGGPVEIVWQSHVTPNYTVEFWQGLIDKFQQLHPDIKIKRVAAPNTDPDTFVRTLLAGGAMPDVVMSIAVSNFIDALRPLAIDSTIQKIKHYKDLEIKGKLYTVGSGLQPLSLVFYNRDLFDKAGITSEPATLSDFENAMQRLKSAGIAPMIVAGEWVPGHVFGNAVGGPNVFSQSPTFWSDFNSKKASMADREWLAAAKSYASWAHNGYFNKGGLGDGYAQGEQNFLAGRGAIYPMGIWFTGSLATTPPPFKVGVFPMPTSSGEKVMCVDYGRPPIAVSATSKNPQAAIAFAEFLALDPYAHSRIIQKDGLLSDLEPPSTYTMIPAQQTIFDSLKTYKTISSADGTGDSIPIPGFLDQLNNAAQKIMLGGDPLQEMQKLDAFRDQYIQTHPQA